ncbi:MAG: mechanosensitive ion channel [Colwellia sp.]
MAITNVPTDQNITSTTIIPTDLLQQEIDQMANLYTIIIEFFTNYSFQLIGALLIFIIGYVIANKISTMVLKLCQRHKLDITLSQFLASTSKIVIVIMIAIIALNKLGVSVTPFIAAIGAISLGAGLALQGLLSNYAAGFNIILSRPFVVGDTISVHSVTGVVTEVLLAYTRLKNEDNVIITIPNKHIVGEILHNSKKESLLELSVGIAYQHNPLEVIKILKEAIALLDIQVEEPRFQIGIDDFSDSAINIGIRLWAPTISLYATKYQVYAEVYNVLDKANVTIPFPQRDVHIHQIKE